MAKQQWITIYKLKANKFCYSFSLRQLNGCTRTKSASRITRFKSKQVQLRRGAADMATSQTSSNLRFHRHHHHPLSSNPESTGFLLHLLHCTHILNLANSIHLMNAASSAPFGQVTHNLYIKINSELCIWCRVSHANIHDTILNG